MSYILKKWKEDNMEKIGFYDEQGKFHLLHALARDWKEPTIKIINIENGDYAEIKLEELD